MEAATSIRVDEAVKALAFIGDLSMGQPTDQSLRTAWLAAKLATQAGHGEADCEAAQMVSMLRWSGCTANASGFDALLGDDVGGRDAMLTMTLPNFDQLAPHMQPLAQIHCEVSGDIARMLGMGSGIELPLRQIFETFDGHGQPEHASGHAISRTVFVVTIASDLEILARAHGVEGALERITRQADRKYPAVLVHLVNQYARGWLKLLSPEAIQAEIDALGSQTPVRKVPLEMVADVVDLKLPWLTGYSRQAATTARACAEQMGLDTVAQQRIYRAGLLHGIGRAALPNSIWNQRGTLTAGDWERIRLVPYWTARAARHIQALSQETLLASFAYERPDGSGYFRGIAAEGIGAEASALAAAICWVALCAARPWRKALSPSEASAHLLREAEQGRLDKKAVAAVLAVAGTTHRPAAVRPAAPTLSEREAAVLRLVSLGESNKEVARTLAISPSTVRTHIESIFRKLACSSRAAATLKAYNLGLL